jgi:hypothetical protein
MNLLFTVLGAFTLGRLVPRRSAALVAYLIADSFLFSFQTLNVLLTWMSGATGMGGASGFGNSPSGTFPIDYATGEVIGYGAVNLAITTVGVGLVLLGARVRARHAAHVAGHHSVAVG